VLMRGIGNLGPDDYDELRQRLAGRNYNVQPRRHMPKTSTSQSSMTRDDWERLCDVLLEWAQS
jgi:hypothetical protein